MSTEPRKTCRGCGRDLPASAFYLHRSKRDGTRLRPTCKECVTASNAAYRARNPEVVKRAQSNYRLRNQEKRRAATAAWIAANSQHVRAYARQYRAENAGRRSTVMAAWRAREKDSVRAYAAAYRKANRTRLAEAESRRRVAKRDNGVFVITDRDLATLFAGSCSACGTRESLTIDHLIPIVRGGRHSIGNLQLLCGSCNSSKRAQLPIEFRARQQQLRRTA